MDFYSYDGEPHTPRYTGHETFNLRYGWLKKAYDAVTDDGFPLPFRDEGAIARFGVGKNMVSAIKHWAVSCGVIQKGRENDDWETTELGDYIFHSEHGTDPYLEMVTSLWLLHLHLTTRSEKTLVLYAFNFFPDLSFSRDALAASVVKALHADESKPPSAVTLRKDIANLIGTYSTRSLDKKVKVEDIISAPLAELGLISQTSSTNYVINKGAHAPVSSGVFAFALNDFWNTRSQGTRSLSFEAICFDPYSPGRTLALSPQDVISHLKSLDEATNGAMRWVESAGVRTVMRADHVDKFSYAWLSSTSRGRVGVAA